MNFVEGIQRVTRSPAFKFMLVLLLVLLLAVPLLLVYGLVWDREGRARDVRREVSQLWGPEQRALGPFLVVPYTVRIETVQGEKRVETIQERRAVFTPEELQITGTADSKVLRRSIFEIPVYTARLKLSGRFLAPRIGDVAAEVATVRWRDATFVLALSGVSGLKEAASLGIDGVRAVPFSPSVGFPSSHLVGIHARLVPPAGAGAEGPDRPLAAFSFSAELAFNGSIALMLSPAARETRVKLASPWPHPSFSGAFLPDERDVTAKGFTASWRIPHLARSVPEAWGLTDGGLDRLRPYAFGVTLVDPVDFYGLVGRALKYGIMFIAMAFLAVLCLELTSGARVHPVQYLFTGIAMVLFYVLLLSLAEHIGFTLAYAIASVATGGMLAAYVGAAMASTTAGAAMLAIFAIIYGVIYLILQAQDYALLAGAVLGFVVLTIVMFATLRVDWSGASARQPAK